MNIQYLPRRYGEKLDSVFKSGTRLTDEEVRDAVSHEILEKYSNTPFQDRTIHEMNALAGSIVHDLVYANVIENGLRISFEVTYEESSSSVASVARVGNSGSFIVITMKR